ncbi:hypothetical protein CHS0354_003635 [Potamilus streckersoni]|uniref:Uncharacterized protein n=1 Tax=Potamilus streckersoni TaxID=2493646 RepID=A0AAE0S9A6_9BIVA|nr:hypothetical protein CHS0354_003635 [Potamilus streckersoni]
MSRYSRPPNSSLYVRNVPDNCRYKSQVKAYSKLLTSLRTPKHKAKHPKQVGNWLIPQSNAKGIISKPHVVGVEQSYLNIKSRGVRIEKKNGSTEWLKRNGSRQRSRSTELQGERPHTTHGKVHVDPRDADDALYHLDRTRFMGRELEIEFARGDRKTPNQMRSKERSSRRMSPYRSSRYDDDYYDRRYRKSRSRSPRRSRSKGRRSYSRSRSRSRSDERKRSPSPRRSRSYSRSVSKSPVRGESNKRSKSKSPSGAD